MLQSSFSTIWSDKSIYKEHIRRYPNDDKIKTRLSAIRNVLQRSCDTCKRWDGKVGMFRHIGPNQWQLISELPHVSKVVTLETEIKRMAKGILNRVKQGGQNRNHVLPIRTAQNRKILELLMCQKWTEQVGKCALCDRQIPVSTTNSMLKMSPDRIDSYNPAYDESNLQITHLGCNWAKNKCSRDEYHEWLNMLRIDDLNME